MNSREAFEAWYQNEYVQFGRANFHLNSYGEYFDDDIEASWCAWQAALASQQGHIPDVGKMVQSQAQQRCPIEPVQDEACSLCMSGEGSCLASQTQQETVRQDDWIPTMDIRSKQGDRVVFSAHHGLESSKNYAKGFLKVGEIYEVEFVDIHQSASYVKLKGFKSTFNTVLFSPAPEGGDK